MRAPVVVIFISLLAISHCQPAPDDNGTKKTGEPPVPIEDHPNSVELRNGTYYLYWSLARESIIFEVHVRTLGWFGLGLTNNGRMMGADMFVGWIKDGVTYFKDRHGEGNFQPLVDDQQDYKVHLAMERDDFTIFQFSRTLITCDPDDYDIKAGTVRMIFAWNEDDPASEADLMYHGANNRGIRSVVLLDYAQPQNTDLEDQNLQSFDIFQNMVNVSSEEITHYHCRYVKQPEFDKKHHIVKIEPRIEEKNLGIVHHILIYKCSDPKRIPQEHGYVCDGETGCNSLIYAWAIGQAEFDVPKEAGLPIESSDEAQYYLIETHYDNPLLKEDFVDSSGIRMHYTDQLRQNDMGVLTLGNTVTFPPMFIPPGMDRLEMNTFCGSGCTENMIPKDGIHMFASILHTHLVGVAMWTKHIRDGVELPEIIRDDHYDNNFQAVRTLPKPVTVFPGDEMITTCVYSTPGKTAPVYGGPGTDNEMCLNFMMYYPLVELQSCISHLQATEQLYALVKESAADGDFGPNFNNPQQRETYGYLPYVKWDDAAKERVQREMDEATHYEQYCIETGGSLAGDYSDLDSHEPVERIQIRTPYVDPNREMCGPLPPIISGSNDVRCDHLTLFFLIMSMFVLKF